MFSDRKRIKYGLRSMLDLLAAATGLLQWHERCMRQGLTILMYHRILPAAQCRAYPLASLVIPIDVFRQQLRWLAARCRVVPVRDALAEISAGGTRAKPLVAVTFDDGYNDNHSLAAPILEEYGLRGTFFVTSGFVAEGRPQWYDRAAVAWQHAGRQQRRLLLQALPAMADGRLAENVDGRGIQTWMEGLKRTAAAERMKLVMKAETLAGKFLDLSGYQPMSPEQVKDLHGRGHEVASHTVSHPILPQLSDTSLAAELRDSAAQLNAWTGAAVSGFCYPNGDYDLRVEEAVLEAGYGYACTVEEGRNQHDVCPTRLARLPMTMQRIMSGCSHDHLGFRAELCRVRALWRR